MNFTALQYLHCTAVRCEKRFLVDKHRGTAKHQRALPDTSQSMLKKVFLQPQSMVFSKKIVNAFSEQIFLSTNSVILGTVFGCGKDCAKFNKL